MDKKLTNTQSIKTEVLRETELLQRSNSQRIDALETSMKELIGMVSTLVEQQTKVQQVKTQPVKSTKVSTKEKETKDIKKDYGWEQVEINGVKIYKSGSFYYAKASQLKDNAKGWIASKQVKGYMTTKYNKSLYYVSK